MIGRNHFFQENLMRISFSKSIWMMMLPIGIFLGTGLLTWSPVDAEKSKKQRLRRMT